MSNFLVNHVKAGVTGSLLFFNPFLNALRFLTYFEMGNWGVWDGVRQLVLHALMVF